MVARIFALGRKTHFISPCRPGSAQWCFENSTAQQSCVLGGEMLQQVVVSLRHCPAHANGHFFSFLLLALSHKFYPVVAANFALVVAGFLQLLNLPAQV